MFMDLGPTRLRAPEERNVERLTSGSLRSPKPWLFAGIYKHWVPPGPVQFVSNKLSKKKHGPGPCSKQKRREFQLAILTATILGVALTA
jgi:hypothetical protein